MLASSEWDGVDTHVSKAVSGSGTFEFTSTGIEVVRFEINEHIDLLEPDTA